MAKAESIDITFQTLYSELVQRSLDETFRSEFSSEGRFVAAEVKGRKYWYFDAPKEGVAKSGAMSARTTIRKLRSASKPEESGV